MEVLYNESLKRHTTIKIGGIARHFYIPENCEELYELIEKLDNYRIISGGSNLLINDREIFENIIYMGKACTEIKSLGEGQFYCGASVRIQQFIKFINEAGYGGIEELVSVPGMMGGLIYMNASIGNDVIVLSDYIISVTVLHNDRIEELQKNECSFGHRTSLFKKGGYVILGARFQFEKQDIAVSQHRKTERLRNCKEKLDYSGYNFGSLFMTCDYKLMSCLSRARIKSGGAELSKKTVNWINNDGTAVYRDIKRIINICSFVHRIFGKKIEPEICIWDTSEE